MNLKAIASITKKLQPLSNWFMLAACAAAWWYVMGIMNTQSPIALIVKSNVTLNFVLFLGFWGYYTQRYAERKKWSKRKGTMFWLITTAALFVLFRLAGMDTIFG